MRLMARRVFTVLSALSLALLVAVGLGWAGSAAYDDVRVRRAGGCEEDKVTR